VSRASLVFIVFEDYARDSRVRRHARALAAEHEVTVLALGGASAHAAARDDGVCLITLGARKYRGRHPLLYLAAYARFLVGALVTVIRPLFSRKMRAVWVNNPPDLLVLAGLPAKLRGIPVLLDIHDMTSALFDAKFGKANRLLRDLVALTETLSYRAADAVVTVHDGYAERIAARAKRPVVAIVNVPDDEQWLKEGEQRSRSPAHPAPPLVVGHHGTIVERYGADIAVRAVLELREQGIDVRLRILGDGDFAPDLDRLIATGDRDGGILFERRVFRPEEVLEFARQIDIGIAPYRISPFTDEALPVKILEYLTLGVPVISTSLTCLRRYLGPDAVYYLPEPTVECVKQAILNLMAPDQREKQSVAGLRAARRLAWPGQRKRLLAWLDEVAPLPAAPRA
jgi:glycosyltransferase involved in cell wall biosynthesis